jgi:magnesium transporter
MGRLVGRIITDDIIDVIRDEGQGLPIGCGISKDVEADDSVLELSKARLPGWF